MNQPKSNPFIITGVVWGIVSLFPYILMVGGSVPVSRTTAILTLPGWLASSLPYMGQFDAVKFGIPLVIGGLMGFGVYLAMRFIISARASKRS